MCPRHLYETFVSTSGIGSRHGKPGGPHRRGANAVSASRGYARTTARDIAAAAGTSLAAIGYHFGSKEALLSVALIETSGAELGDEIERAILDVDA